MTTKIANSQEEVFSAIRQNVLVALSNTLTEVSFYGRNIGTRGIKCLVECLKASAGTLTELNLGANYIDPEGAKSLAEYLKTRNVSLSSLNLGSNNIGDEGAQYLSDSLKNNSTLTTLHLHDNKIGLDGARSISECLKSNNTLKTLHLTNNALGTEGAKYLAKSLECNNALTTLHLYGNKVTPVVIEEIDKRLILNKQNKAPINPKLQQAISLPDKTASPNSSSSLLNMVTFVDNTPTVTGFKEQGNDIQATELILIKKLGEGAFGEVWKGLWKDSVHVAIKKIKSAAQNVVNQAKQEAQLLMQNRFSNIVLFYGICEDGDNLLLVTELMEGGDLYRLLHEDNTKLTPKQLKHLALDVVSGLCILHSQKPMIVHRDLKSMNILLDRSQTNAKIGDFGLAQTKNTLSLISKIAGTFNWMAPEVMQDRPYTEKADIYSLGMVLYEMVTNQIPFGQCNQMQLYHKVCISKERPELNQVPREWKQVISQCWEDDPENRPSAREVLKIIEKIN